jgi:hypothetical protein
MTPEEKAKELVNKFLQVYDGRVPIAKKCALIAVEEVLGYMGADRGIDFWQSVKQEIEKI